VAAEPADSPAAPAATTTATSRGPAADSKATPRARTGSAPTAATTEGQKSLAANDIGAASYWRSCLCSSSRWSGQAHGWTRRCTAFPALADYPERPATGKGTTWLLVGSDSRQGLTPEQQAELTTGDDLGAGRTDTILLVHVPAIGSSTPTTMVSIPRDSYVPIPGNGEDKINAAYTFGGAPLWRRPSSRPPGSGSTTTPRLGSTASPSWSTPSAE